MEVKINEFSRDTDFYNSWEEMKEAILQALWEGMSFEDVPEVFRDTDEDGNPTIKDCFFEAEEEELEAFETYIDNTSDESLSNFRDAYQGKYISLLEFATEYAKEHVLPTMPESARMHFDFESYASDFHHDYFFENGFVFRNI